MASRLSYDCVKTKRKQTNLHHFSQLTPLVVAVLGAAVTWSEFNDAYLETFLELSARHCAARLDYKIAFVHVLIFGTLDGITLCVEHAQQKREA